MINKFSVIIIFILLVLLNSCQKEGEMGPKGKLGANGLRFTGQLTGVITADDGYYNQINDKAGFVVTAQNKDTTVKATSDIKGNYVLNGLKSGTFNITIERKSFVTVKQSNVSFLGGDQPEYKNFTISKWDTSTFILDSINNNLQKCYFKTSNSIKRNYQVVIVFLHTLDNVSNKVYTVQKLVFGLPFEYDNFYNYHQLSNYLFYFRDLKDAALPKGTKVYAKCYVNGNNWGDFDPETGKIVFSWYSPYGSDVISFTAN